MLSLTSIGVKLRLEKRIHITVDLTVIACCMKSMAISKPNSSPARRVNLLIMEQAPKIDSKTSNIAVHTHTLKNSNSQAPFTSNDCHKLGRTKILALNCNIWKNHRTKYQYYTYQKNNKTKILVLLAHFGRKKAITHHPAHARNRLRPNSGLSFAKLNMNVYIITVGSATPKISKGCPPMIECIIPQIAVDAKVWTAVKTPSANRRRNLYHFTVESKASLHTPSVPICLSI